MQSSTSTKTIEDRLLDIGKLEDVNPETIRKMYKMKTILDFLDAKDKNKKLSQKTICDSIGISRSSLYRTRRDLGMSSLNRYEVSVTTEAQRKKDKVRRTITDLYKTNSIDINERDSLRDQINDNNLEKAVSRIRELTVAKKAPITTSGKRGGTVEDATTAGRASDKQEATEATNNTSTLSKSSNRKKRGGNYTPDTSQHELTAEEIIDKFVQ